jgi:endonuclease/exonuclease/phosphatase family metal-dependent hydrolase
MKVSKMYTLLTWNILYGFHDMKNAWYEPARLAACQELIKQENPDILVINEAAFGESFMGRHIDYKNIFDFPNMVYQPSNHEWGNVIYSKFPITRAISKSLDIKTSLGCEININGKMIMIETYHPHPYWLEEHKQVLFEELIKNRPTNYILTGDFNAISHKDHNPFGYSLVIPMLESKGLVDAFGNNRESTFPTKMLVVDDKNPNVRLDHCFVSKSIIVKKSNVIKNDLADLASDHYPIRIEFSF